MRQRRFTRSGSSTSPRAGSSARSALGMSLARVLRPVAATRAFVLSSVLKQKWSDWSVWNDQRKFVFLHFPTHFWNWNLKLKCRVRLHFCVQDGSWKAEIEMEGSISLLQEWGRFEGRNRNGGVWTLKCNRSLKLKSNPELSHFWNGNPSFQEKKKKGEESWNGGGILKLLSRLLHSA